jgi:acyl-CoA dehydrogenase
MSEQAGISIPLDDDAADIREAVRKVCAEFPGAYWRDVEKRGAYPLEFVQALTRGGYLGADPRGVRRLRPAARAAA